MTELLCQSLNTDYHSLRVRLWHSFYISPPFIPTTAEHSALLAGGENRQVGLTVEEPRNWNSMMDHIDHVRNLIPSRGYWQRTYAPLYRFILNDAWCQLNTFTYSPVCQGVVQKQSSC